MKHSLLKMLPVILILALLFSACAGSREGMHNSGVNNKGYKGY